MIEGIEGLYQVIADAMNNAIPVEWVSAQCTATFFPDGIDFFAEYTPVKGSPRGVAVSDQITDAFEELRKKFKDAGQPVWGQALFQMTSDGKFKMKWGYDNCDKNGNTILDEEQWARHVKERRHRVTRPD